MELAGLTPKAQSGGVATLLASRNAPATGNHFALTPERVQTRGALKAGNDDTAANNNRAATDEADINNSRAATAAMDAQSEGTQALMDNLLQMMLAQIKNQDPTNPMDNNQLASQMAQMHVALGVEKLNNTVLGMGQMVNSVQAVNLSSWVGRTVLIAGKPSVSFEGQTAYGFELPSGADEVRVTFTDEEGKTYTQEYKDVKAGAYKLDINKAQTTPPLDHPSSREEKAKIHEVSFEAKNKDESRPTINALKAAKVENVFFSGGSAKLALGLDGSIYLKDVILIE